jgi:hypothetical protein
MAILAGLAESKKDEHRLGQDLSRHKPEYPSGRRIQPLRVIDDAEQRTLQRDLS